MKRALLFAVALGVSTALFAAEDGARIVDDAWLKAIQANDLDAVVATYAEDATMYPPDEMEAKGKEEIRENYSILLGANTVQEVKMLDRHYRTAGDVSVGWGRVTLVLKPKSGDEPVSLDVRFSAIAVKRGGKWLYLVDHASAPLPSSK